MRALLIILVVGFFIVRYAIREFSRKELTYPHIGTRYGALTMPIESEQK